MNNYNKTDRRVWNKSNQSELNLELPEDESRKKRYDDYLFNLHLNNQLSKMLTKKDKHEEDLTRLENGFNLYVNGAHKKQEKYTPRYTTATQNKSSVSNSSKFQTKLNFEWLSNSRSSSSTPNATSRQNTSLTTNRKKWANSSFIFKTSDGYEIKINSPNRYDLKNNEPSSVCKVSNQSNECDYSDDFESDEDDDDDDNKTTINKRKDLIENVKFSDQEDEESESFDEIDAKIDKKKFAYKLTKNDVKLLRKSFAELNDSIQSDDSLNRKKQIDTLPEEIDSDPEINNDNSNNNSEIKSKSSAICNLILEKAVFLKRKDRENLVDFLSRIDEQ